MYISIYICIGASTIYGNSLVVAPGAFREVQLLRRAGPRCLGDERGLGRKVGEETGFELGRALEYMRICLRHVCVYKYVHIHIRVQTHLLIQLSFVDSIVDLGFSRILFIYYMYMHVCMYT